MEAAHLDKETRSAANLPKVGAHRYAQDPTTSVILASYRFGSQAVEHYLGELPPPALVEHVRQGGRVIGHNAAFERQIWNNRVLPLTGVELKIEQQDCTMARAAALGLPQSLDRLGSSLRLNVQKDKAGHTLMMKMCKAGYEPKPGELERLAEYCDQDVATECCADNGLPPLSERERRVWELDQRINDRGFQIDVERALVAQQVVEEAKRAADRAMWEATGGAVSKATEVKKLTGWLNSRGIVCTSVADGEIDTLLVATDLFDDESAAQALRIRRASAGAFKFQAMLAAVCRDGRVRDSLAYHGTHGGRWAGRVVQPQNMKRMEDEEDEHAAAVAIELLGSRRPAHEILAGIDLMAGNPLEVLSLCARPMIIAAPGKKLVDADFSNIEGRLNAWFAGAEWKLDAFRSFDAGEGPDLYKVTAAAVLDRPVEAIGKPERQLHGKVPELACGYQGGVHALQKSGLKAGLNIPAKHAQQIVTGWRASNPEIVQSWYDLNDAAIAAVDSPGLIVPVLGGKVRYTSNGSFLFCQLPSGRVISYASPSVEWKKKVITIDDEQVELNKRGVSYWGVKGGRLLKLDLYGGAQCAHIVSGTARDILVEAMFAVEAAGYPIVLTVHDEILSEVDVGFGSADEFEQIILASKPKWIGDMPLVTKAWEDTRYAK